VSRGFTLVETLVALFVFGLIAAAGVVVLGNSADAQLRIGEASASVQDMQRLRAALRADLGQLAVRVSRSPSGARQPAFVTGGDAGVLFSFVRRGWENPDAAPRASLQQVTYRLAGARLERLAAPHVDGAAAGAPAVLFSDVSAVRVAYYDSESWRDDWDARRADALPSAIRLDITSRRFGEVRQLFLVGGGA